MKPQEFCRLIKRLVELPSETNFCEFKMNLQDADKMGVLISAIANAACLAGERLGYIVWGVRDGSHEIIGTSFDIHGVADAGKQPLELWLAQHIQPGIDFSFKEGEVEGKRLVVLLIPAAASVSTKFKHVSYIRVGSTTPKLSDFPEREAALMGALRPYVWESGHAASNLSIADALDALDVEAYYDLVKRRRPSKRADLINELVAQKILEREFSGAVAVTNLGAMLLANDISHYESVARKAARVVFYEGKSRATTIKERPERRGYVIGFNSLIEYIMERLPQEETVKGGLRTIVPAFPELMIREAVANALVHQDFSIRGCNPQIEVFKDRIEITNPGRPLIEPERFIDMPPRSRNERMASMMRKLYICEERGIGVDRIVMAAEAERLPAPDFRIDGDNSKVILFGPRIFKETSSTERVRACYQHTVICFIKHERMTNASLRHRLGVDESQSPQISRIIAEALKRELIKQSDGWSARSGSYVPWWA